MKHLITLFVASLIGCTTLFPAAKPLPAGARDCAWDYDCGNDEHCGFPGLDTSPQCLPGRAPGRGR
jgi:hypothetical protein